MEEFLHDWNVKFGPGVDPPEWVFNSESHQLKQSKNARREITECVGRVDKLKRKLDQELFLLHWLRELHGSTEGEEGSGSIDCHVREEDLFVSESYKRVSKTERVEGEVSNLVPTSKCEDSPEFLNFNRALGCTPTSRSEYSPVSSEYFTAGLNSCSDITSIAGGESSPVSIRDRFVHNVTSKDFQVAKIVRRKLEEGHHWSCINLSQITIKGETLIHKPSLRGRHKRFHSAPALKLEALSHQGPSRNIKKRGLSAPGAGVLNDSSIDSEPVDPSQLCPTSPLESNNSLMSTTEQKPSGEEKPNTFSSADHPSDDANSQTGVHVSYVRRVVLRDRTKSSKSLSIETGRESGSDLSQWKGSVSSSISDQRSSNGILDSLDSYNFITSHDDDGDDPAVLNVMAGRIRSTRNSRTSIDQQPPLLDPSSSADYGTSPNHIPISDSESSITSQTGEGGNSKHVPAFIRRRNTDSSFYMRDRVSYHYSDDECLTPKLEVGDPMTFAVHSPRSSQGYSHRNSRNSNGILNEETAAGYDLTLRKGSLMIATSDDPKNTSTAAVKRATGDEHQRRSTTGSSLARRRDQEDKNESVVTTTLTDRVVRDLLGTDDLCTSPTDGLSTLGGLDLDIESSFSKLRDKPEMSMAGLLDMSENQRMNATRNSYRGDLDATSDFGDTIDIDEATISAFTLSNNLYGSRANSASSIPGLFSDTSGASSSSPPEPESPTRFSPPSTAAATSAALHGVNLRLSGGAKRLNRKRMCNADFEAFSVERGGKDGFDTQENSPSRSFTSQTSEEESVEPLSSLGPEADGQLLVSDNYCNRVLHCLCVCVVVLVVAL